MTDIIRVLRIVEYIGPRDQIEKQIENSIHGTKRFGIGDRECSITATTLGTFPEILNKEPAVVKPTGNKCSDYQQRNEMFAATPGCDGEIIAAHSGIKCSKCKGWFCY